MKKQISDDVLTIDEIKTGFMGYNKEAVLEYILLLLKKMDKVKEEELHQMSEKVSDLEKDNKRLQSQLDIYKENYGMLNRQLDEMAKAWKQNVQYTGQRDSLLREYQQKGASIDARLDRAKRRARHIMEEADAHKIRMLEQTNKECDEIIKQEQERVTMCKLELAKIVCQLIPIIKDEAYGEAARLTSAEREAVYGDHL